jgi:hypothetical protein
MADSTPEEISLNRGVVDDGESLAPILETIEGEQDVLTPMDTRPTGYDSINAALDAYKSGQLMPAGMGLDRGYTATISFSVAGVISLITGGVLLAKGHPVLGSVGVGVSAGCGVGSYVTYPETVPLVGYHLRMSEDKFVSIRIPEGLDDDEFIECSGKQAKYKTKMKRYSIPTVLLIEQAEARRDQRADLSTPDSVSSSSFGFSGDFSDEEEEEEEEEEQEDVIAVKEKEEQAPPAPAPASSSSSASAAAPAPSAPAPAKKDPSGLSGAVGTKSSKEKQAERKGSGVAVV